MTLNAYINNHLYFSLSIQGLSLCPIFAEPTAETLTERFFLHNVRIAPIVNLRRNSNIMRTALYSIERLLSFFKVNITATMTQLKAVLGTTVDMTVYRKLRKLSYLTSYSHHGKYYTLHEVTRFDSLGLWRHSDARFSKYGTLINTAQALVTLAEKGYSLSELRRIVGCEVKETVLTLVRQNRIHREIIDGQFVYFAANLATQQKQHRLRMKAKTRPGDQEPDVLAHEVRAAIILFVSLLDEKQRRLYAGLESLRIGRGGDAQIARTLDLDTHTVAKGRHQLLNRDLEIERVRRKGAGRPSIKKNSSDH